MLLLFLIGVLLPSISNGQTAKHFGLVSVDNPGIVNLFKHRDASGEELYSLLVSSYDTRINTKDKSFILLQPGKHMATNFTDYGPTLLYDQLYWTKQIEQAPYDIFGFDGVIQPDGTGIIGKLAGAVYITDITDLGAPRTSDMTTPLIPSTDFYNFANVLWKKITTIGNTDFITCRVVNSGGSLKTNELVWYQNPRVGDPLTRWSPSVIWENACETKLAQVQARDGLIGTFDVLYTTGLYSKNLSIFWAETERGLPGSWDNAADIKYRILESGREYYDVVGTFDLNNDGKVDILATIVANDGGSVEVWEVPQNSYFRDPAQYAHHILAYDFVSRNAGTSGRAPGVVTAFVPVTPWPNKPWILVAGGDEGRVWYLRPNSEHPGDWTYTKVLVCDQGASQPIDGVAAADINGDGYTEIFISIHNRNRVEIYTFGPL